MTEFIQINTPLLDDVPVTGERVSEHFAITPTFGRYQDGGPVHIAGGTSLTHIRTGRTVTRDTWLDLRDLAARLEALPIEWDVVSRFTKEQGELVQDALKAARDANAESDHKWPWPEWAGDESTPALSTLANMIDTSTDSLTRYQRFSDLGDQASVAIADEDLARRVRAHLTAAASVMTVNEYGVVYLLAVLHRIDPEAADRAARDLVSEWEAGDTMSEWVYQWRRELAQGDPLTLHGFPYTSLTAEAPATPTEGKAATHG